MDTLIIPAPARPLDTEGRPKPPSRVIELTRNQVTFKLYRRRRVYGVAHEAGTWQPITRTMRLTANRRKMVNRVLAERERAWVLVTAQPVSFNVPVAHKCADGTVCESLYGLGLDLTCVNCGARYANR